jgi:hypothetical protein
MCVGPCTMGHLVGKLCDGWSRLPTAVAIARGPHTYETSRWCARDGFAAPSARSITHQNRG